MKHLKNYWPLLGLSAFAFALTLFRIKFSGHYTYIFLIWNLFLAALPILFAELYVSLKLQKIRLLYLALWFLFIPNSFYILTDLFHLRVRHPLPLWFDLMLILSYALTGLFMGYHSLYLIQNQFKTKTWIKQVAFPFVVIFSSSFGIYLGRFLRFNSWDILTKPHHLFFDITHRLINPLSHSTTVGVTFGFGILLYLIYLTIFSNSFKNNL